MHRPHFAVVAFVVCVTFAVAAAQTAYGQLKLGVMGDSLSDEYSEASYGSYAKNWVQQLAIYGGVNVGPTAAGQPGGTWGEPRRKGYEYNWARAGDTTDTLLSHGQHTSLAAQVPLKGIGYGVLAIGANDFAPGSTAYTSIYNGAWSQGQINTYVNQRVANVQTALNTVIPSGIKMALVNFPDYGVAPVTWSNYTDPVKRERVTTVITQLNSQLAAVAQAKQIPLVDLQGVARAVFGTNAAQKSVLSIGNVNINLLVADTNSGTNPTAGFVHDGTHPNTTLQGLLSNTFMTALNAGYGAGAPIFTEAQVLSHRGLAYGGSDTVAGQIGLYNDYVVNYALPGDVNADGVVNLVDVQTVGLHWHTSTYRGDGDYNGFVDLVDVQVVGMNWGHSSAGQGTAVPEPAGAILALSALLLWACRRGRIRRDKV